MKILLLLITFIYVIFSCCSLVNVYARQPLKIIMVHSYTPEYTCTAPQAAGLQKNLNLLTEKYLIIQKEYYMKAKTVNINDTSKKEVSKILFNEIDEFKPDYIFITDDPAFQYVGIPLSQKYKVLASGINRPITSYKEEFPLMNLDNLVVVEETFRLDMIFTYFEKAKFIPTSWWVFYDDTETSYYMMKDYEREITGKGKFIPVYIKDIPNLREELKKLQKENIGIICITLQSLYDPDKRRNLSKDEFFEEFIFFNKKQLELGGNPDFGEIGFAICAGPDFQIMGDYLSKYFINNIKNWTPTIIKPITTVSINKKRLIKLGFSRLLDDGLKFRIYNGY